MSRYKGPVDLAYDVLNERVLELQGLLAYNEEYISVQDKWQEEKDDLKTAMSLIKKYQ